MMPTRKVSVGAVAGAITILAVWVFRAWKPNVEVPLEVAQGFTVILTAVVSFIVPDGSEEA